MINALVPFRDHPYFLWQVLVHWTWMQSHGYPVTYLAYTAPRGEPSKELLRIKYEAGAPITVWNDWRAPALRRYGPGMKLGMVARWMESHPDAVDSAHLLLDPDALPLPSFAEAVSRLIPTPVQWYGTDVHSYAGPGYLKSKGEDLWVGLCKLVGVEPEEAATYTGVGAQLLVTGKGHEFWDEAHRLSCEAHRMLVEHPSDVQVWCAEMYITQLIMIREGITPLCYPEMAMLWANGKPERWDDGTAGFYHNAGVPAPNGGKDFCKIEWQGAPFGETIEVSPESASSRYVDIIREAAQRFPWA